MSDSEQTGKRKDLFVRLPVTDIELMNDERKSLNLSQSKYLSQLIRKRAKTHRKNDGLQIARLKSLHDLKVLLDTHKVDEIDRREEAQRLFDHLYEMFFSEQSESARDDDAQVNDGNE